MPTHKSAAKRMKTSEVSRLRNRRFKSTIRASVKAVEAEKDKEKKSQLIKSATSAVDKAAGRNVIHKNKAARIKSRLSKLSGSK